MPVRILVFDQIEFPITTPFLDAGFAFVSRLLVIMHFMQIRRTSLLPQEQLTFIENCLSKGAVDDALGYCVDPANDTYLTRILATGLLPTSVESPDTLAKGITTTPRSPVAPRPTSLLVDTEDPWAPIEIGPRHTTKTNVTRPN